MRMIAMAAVLACSGCVVIYAPRAERAAIQQHEQQAGEMTIYQRVPIEPRVANEVTGAKVGPVLSPSLRGSAK